MKRHVAVMWPLKAMLPFPEMLAFHQDARPEVFTSHKTLNGRRNGGSALSYRHFIYDAVNNFVPPLPPLSPTHSQSIVAPLLMRE